VPVDILSQNGFGVSEEIKGFRDWCARLRREGFDEVSAIRQLCWVKDHVAEPRVILVARKSGNHQSHVQGKGLFRPCLSGCYPHT